jgi:hypothetical protein
MASERIRARVAASRTADPSAFRYLKPFPERFRVMPGERSVT